MTFFAAIDQAECCLCGSTEKLTGEHKIKASALRRIFGRNPMMIGHFDGDSEPKLAQGPKSSNLHFKARLCEKCNTARTKPADLEFDRFHELIVKRWDGTVQPTERIPADIYPEGSVQALNVFRYFAKLLSCQIAEIQGPRLIPLAAFAIGQSDHNLVRLAIKADSTYLDVTALSEDLSDFAGHGGLTVTHSKDEILEGFHSSLTLGPVQYVYRVEFGPIVADDLKRIDPRFAALCREALDHPLSAHERQQLGFGAAADKS